MNPLQTILTKRLEGAARIAVLGIGSDLRGDDVAGLLAAEEIDRKYRRQQPRNSTLAVFLGHTAPENLTGEIREFKPDHILMIDAADLGREVGAIEIIEPHEPVLHPPVTHGFPIPLLERFFVETMACSVTIIGIQPSDIAFNHPPSAAVRRAALELAAIVVDSLP